MCNPGVVFVASSHHTTRKPPAGIVVGGKTNFRVLLSSVRLQPSRTAVLPPVFSNSIQSGCVPAFATEVKFVAAIIVAFIVIQVSAKLGMRTINALLDSAPAGAQQKIIAAVEGLPRILDCHSVRIRSAGHQ